MQHSIAAKYAARPTARFVRAPGRERERRLGLRRSLSFTPAAGHMTVVQRTGRGPLAGLHSTWRSITPARPARRMSGLPRPVVVFHWTRFGSSRPDRHSSAAPAPWRA